MDFSICTQTFVRTATCAVCTHSLEPIKFNTLNFCLDFKYTPLCKVNPNVLEELLMDHPDRGAVRYVVDGFHHGFHLGSGVIQPFCKKKKPKKHKIIKKSTLLQEKSTFLTQILNKNEYFTNDYCEFS